MQNLYSGIPVRMPWPVQNWDCHKAIGYIPGHPCNRNPVTHHQLPTPCIEKEAVLRSRTCELLPMYSPLTALTLTAYLLTQTATRFPVLTDRLTYAY
jgi:hypothetical protein